MSLTPAEQLQQLSTGTLRVIEVLTDASNLTLRVSLDETGSAVYKPVSGERALHDFPAGSLAGREVASFLVSQAGGWDLVPPTVRRDGPLGPGAVQWWVEQDPQDADRPGAGLIEVFPAGAVPADWLPVLRARTEDGADVCIAHADDTALRSLAVLDVVLNNTDRKGSHLLRDTEGRLWAIDHGICLHEQDKVRTVLWGWAGQPIPDAERDRLHRLAGALDTGRLPTELAQLLDGAEVDAIRARVSTLLDQPTHPLPPTDRYPLPWPLW